jgi:ketol-acid reductoisomerase
MKIQNDENVKIDTLKKDPIAIIGYGSQGRAHARNLHESGFDVTVGVREGGPSWKQAKTDGLKVATPEEAAKKRRKNSMKKRYAPA